MKANAHNHLACEKVQQFFFHNCEPTYLTFRSRFQMGDTTIYSYMYVCGIFPTVEDFKCVKQNSIVRCIYMCMRVLNLPNTLLWNFVLFIKFPFPLQEGACCAIFIFLISCIHARTCCVIKRTVNPRRNVSIKGQDILLLILISSIRSIALFTHERVLAATCYYF